MPNLPIRIGGVMRCCIETYDEYSGPEDQGTILPCKYCDQSLVVSDGFWGWLHPDDHHDPETPDP